MQPSIEFFFLIILIYRPRPFYAHKELLHDQNFHMTVNKKNTDHNDSIILLFSENHQTNFINMNSIHV